MEHAGFLVTLSDTKKGLGLVQLIYIYFLSLFCI